MKAGRQTKILQLIQNYEINTQDELLRRLREEGFDVTQATISRDIKELRIIKASSPDGKYRYATGKDGGKDSHTKFYSLFIDSVLSVVSAKNMVCIKSLPGMAQAICAAMDSLPWKGVVGTIAGDDTIFVLCNDNACAAQLTQKLCELQQDR